MKKKWVDGLVVKWVEGWIEGWMEGRAGLHLNKTTSGGMCQMVRKLER